MTIQGQFKGFAKLLNFLLKNHSHNRKCHLLKGNFRNLMTNFKILLRPMCLLKAHIDGLESWDARMAPSNSGSHPIWSLRLARLTFLPFDHRAEAACVQSYSIQQATCMPHVQFYHGFGSHGTHYITLHYTHARTHTRVRARTRTRTRFENSCFSKTASRLYEVGNFSHPTRGSKVEIRTIAWGWGVRGHSSQYCTFPLLDLGSKMGGYPPGESRCQNFKVVCLT